MPNVWAIVRPEPIEAPEPRAFTPRDALRFRALLHGWHRLCARTATPVGFEAYVASVDAYETQDRRRADLPDLEVYPPGVLTCATCHSEMRLRDFCETCRDQELQRPAPPAFGLGAAR